MSGLADAVRQRARDCCEYCRLPQGRSAADSTSNTLSPGNMADRQASTTGICLLDPNLRKGPNLSGLDPSTGLVTALFHPREHQWLERSCPCRHADPLGIEIRGLTPVGRATVQVLALNEEMRQMVRYELWLEGLYIIGT